MAKSITNQWESLIAKTKREAAETLISQTLNLLSHAPEREYIRFADALQRLAGGSNDSDSSESQPVNWMRNWMNYQSGTAYVKRIVTQMNPKMRKNFIATVLTGVVFRPEEVLANVRRETGIEPLATILLSPTMRCNYHCTGCYAGSYIKDDDMPGETFDRVVTEAKETLGIRFFTISGGEPFVYKPLLDTFRKHNDCAFQVFTNGSLLNEQVCDTIADLGNVAPCISIEGDEQTTDARRGQGAYQRVMDAFDRLKARGIVFAFSATATRQNVDSIISDEFGDMMVQKGAYYGWYFTYVPIGRNPDLDLMPTPEQRNQLRLGVTRLRSTKPIFLADFWNDGPAVGGCIASGRHYFHINNKGDIEPCVFCHFATHNVNNSTLVEAIKSPLFAGLRSKQPFNRNLLKPCPLIDNPKVIRWAVKEFGAYPTHEGAEMLLTDLADGLDKYSTDYGKISDAVWQKEYDWAESWAETQFGSCYRSLGFSGDPEKIDMSDKVPLQS